MSSAREAPPEETAELAPGPHLGTAQGDRGALHSSKCSLTQPRPRSDPRAFWIVQVVAMQVYGVSVADTDLSAVVDHLVGSYGKQGGTASGPPRLAYPKKLASAR